MVQYDEIKSNYSDSILLFRMGDFYETFGQDATIASEILGIVLTKRSNGKASDVNLAGFPYHSLDNYLPKLIKAGHKVAICEQIEDPRQVKGIVKRKVIEVVTPGTITSEKVLDAKKNNYIASLIQEKIHLGIQLLILQLESFMWVNVNQMICMRPSQNITLVKFFCQNQLVIIFKIGL